MPNKGAQDAPTQRGLCLVHGTIVFDHFITDTARYADLVLPATTQFEHFDVQGAWGHFYASSNNPAVAPMGETKSGGELMRELAVKLGLDHSALRESDEEIAASALPDGCSLDDLKRDGWRKLSVPVGPSQPLALLGEGIAGPAPPPPGRLQLLTPKSHYFLNSTFANMPLQRQSQGRASIEINPEDASRLMLSDGDTIRASNGAANMQLPLRVTDTIRPGCAVLEGKWWGGDADQSAEVNRLTPARWSPLGQPAYNETWITIAKA